MVSRTDIFLLVLATAAFVTGLSIGVPPVWLIGSTVIVLMIYIGLRYPRGRADWKYSSIETIYMLSTMVTMLLLVYIIFMAATSIRIPNSMMLSLAIAALAFMVMFLLGMFYPSGGKFSLKKQK